MFLIKGIVYLDVSNITENLTVYIVIFATALSLLNHIYFKCSSILEVNKTILILINKWDIVHENNTKSSYPYMFWKTTWYKLLISKWK